MRLLHDHLGPQLKLADFKCESHAVQLIDEKIGHVLTAAWKGLLDIFAPWYLRGAHGEAGRGVYFARGTLRGFLPGKSTKSDAVATTVRIRTRDRKM